MYPWYAAPGVLSVAGGCCPCHDGRAEDPYAFANRPAEPIRQDLSGGRSMATLRAWPCCLLVLADAGQPIVVVACGSLLHRAASTAERRRCRAVAPPVAVASASCHSATGAAKVRRCRAVAPLWQAHLQLRYRSKRYYRTKPRPSPRATVAPVTVLTGTQTVHPCNTPSPYVPGGSSPPASVPQRSGSGGPPRQYRSASTTAAPGAATGLAGLPAPP